MDAVVDCPRSIRCGASDGHATSCPFREPHQEETFSEKEEDSGEYSRDKASGRP